MKPRTVNENVQRFLEDGREHLQKRGKPHQKWDEEMEFYLFVLIARIPASFQLKKTLVHCCTCFCVFSQLDHNPCLTLEEMNRSLQKQFPKKPKICDSTIAKKKTARQAHYC